MTIAYGRDFELERAAAALDRARAGAGGVILLGGEPGIGKSHLVRAIAEVARQKESRIAWGRCWEVGGAPPLWPFIQVFRALELDEGQLSAFSGDGGTAGRFMILDRAARAIKARCEQTPWTLILDDAHAADVPSLDLALLLAREAGDMRLLLVLAHRTAEAGARPEVAQRLSKIAEEGERMELGRLSESVVVAWVKQACPSASDDLAESVHRRSEGNPLFVRELLRLGQAISARPTAGLVSLLDERLRVLSPRARTLLEAAAVLGREFSIQDAAVLAEMATDAADAAVREAFDAGIIEARGEKLAFSHVLIRDHIHDGMTPLRRDDLHWSVGNLLGERGEPLWGVHHLIAGANGQARRTYASRVALQVARTALDRLAFEDASVLACRALELLGDAPERELIVELSLVNAEALALGGECTQAKQAALECARLARQASDGRALARAALVYASHLVSATVDDTMVALLDEALSALGEDESPLSARIMARLAAARTPPKAARDAEVIVEIARRARATIARFDDPESKLFVLEFVASATGYMAGSDERFELSREVVRLAKVLDKRSILTQVLGWHIACLLERGQRAQAEAHVEDLERAIADLPQPHYRWRLPAVRASIAAFDARFDEADAHSRELYELAMRADAPNARAAWALQRIAVAYGRGDPPAIANEASLVLEMLERLPMLAPYRAWVLAAVGKPNEARQLLGKVAQFALSYPWLIIACDAAVLLGASDRAGALYAALSAHHMQQRFFWGPAGASAFGPTSRTLGDLALLLEKPDEAMEHYRAAVTQCEAAGAKALLQLARRGLERAAGCMRDGSILAPPTPRPAGSHTASASETRAPRDASEPHGNAPAVAPVNPARFELIRDGDIWTVQSGFGPSFHLKHAKGLLYLSYLVDQPGRRIHVLELIGSDERPTDAGTVLDARAKESYRKRLDALAAELADAEALSDGARACRAQEEIDSIAEELARAVGLGGRDRRAASNVERARVNVQRRIKDCLGRISQANEPLGRQLARAVRTGIFCSYDPF